MPIKPIPQNKLLYLALCAFLTASFSGCLATSTEMVGLRDDINELQLKLIEVQRNQADLSAKMDNLSGQLGPVSSNLTETQDRMSTLGQRLDDVESNISLKMNRLSEQLSGTALKVAPPPSEIYRLAYSDYSSGKYDIAVVGFRNYLDKYPAGELAGLAQYYLGECYYSKDEWQKAYDAFDLVEKNYPKSDSAAPARLKKGLALEQMGKVKEGREMISTVIKDYPYSGEAETAREKLGLSGHDVTGPDGK